MNTKEQLINIISNYTDVPTEGLDTSIGLKYLGLNSYVVLSMVSEIENEFNISIPDNELMAFQNMNDIINYIDARR